MPSPIKLESLAGNTPVEIIQTDTGNLTLGRDTENAIVVDSDSVSRVHACLFEVQGSWLLRDYNSTNGTLVNGVKVQGGQVRLLRNEDLIQIANFPIRFTELDRPVIEHPDAIPPTLLVFYNDHFETEYPLATPGATFAIGGPEAHFFLENAAEEIQLQIASNGGRLELTSYPGGASVIINGMSVGGVTTLADRDEIDLGPYKIIVNDSASARASKQNKMIAALEAQKNARPSQIPILARVGTGENRAWDYEAESKRKVTTGRKFVFGTSPDEDENNVTGTVAMTRQEMAYKVGEVGSARFSQSAPRLDQVTNPESAERRQMIIGILVLIALIGALAYFISTL